MAEDVVAPVIGLDEPEALLVPAPCDARGAASLAPASTASAAIITTTSVVMSPAVIAVMTTVIVTAPIIVATDSG